MDAISKVKVFVEVVNNQGFAAAGRALGMTGAAVSKQIQNLESQLGVKLLNRTTRHVSLTEEGSLYFKGASRALADLAETEQRLLELKECPTGKLKVNAPMSFGSAFLAKPIAEFARQYPDVEMEVDFSDRWVDVIGEGYDVVVRIGVLQDSTLKARKLANCPIWLCASAECLEREGPISSLADISGYPAVTYSRHGQTEDWRYKAGDEQGSLRLSKAFAANTGEMQLEACLAGVGVALLPAFIVNKYLASGQLVRVLPQYETWPERGIHLLFPASRSDSARVRLFIDSLVAASKSFDW